MPEVVTDLFETVACVEEMLSARVTDQLWTASLFSRSEDNKVLVDDVEETSL